MCGYKWELNQFRHSVESVAHHYWQNVDNQRRKMDEIALKLNIMCCILMFHPRRHQRCT